MNMRTLSPEKSKERISVAFQEGRIKTFQELFSVIRELETIGDRNAQDVILDIRKYLRREKKEGGRFGLSDLPEEDGLQRIVGTLADKLLREMGIEQNKKLPDDAFEKLGVTGNWTVEAISLPKAMVNVMRFVDSITRKESKSTNDTVALERKTITFAQIFNLE